MWWASNRARPCRDSGPERPTSSSPPDVSRTRIIDSHYGVDGVLFGCSKREILELLGEPDKVAENYTGEVEMLFGTTIYRCFEDRFVECTLPDRGRFSINGVEVLSVFDWLAGCADVVDKARFRISLDCGVAYDFRNRQSGSITVFEKGRWDWLVLNC